MSRHSRHKRRRRRRRRRAKQVVDQSLRKAAKEAEGSSRVSLFEAPRKMELRGGEFISAGRDINSTTTINFDRSAVHDNLDDDEIESLIHLKNSQVSQGMNDSRPMLHPSSPPVRPACSIYDQCMALKARGIPMRHPGPSRTLPNVYRRRGIAIGDVGILTEFGDFDFMFNIRLPAHHPINQLGVPEGYSSLSPPLHSSDIYIRTEFNQNSYLASAWVERSHRQNDSSAIVFESSASEGAILALPQGSHAEDLRNFSRFRQYLSANAVSWYKYVNDVRGREARNGDVRLVVGCDKASSWGMASFANSTAQGFHMEFKPTAESGSRQTYGWDYSGVVEARAGPDPEEMEELRSTDGSGHLGVYTNQCLFIRTLDATLRDDVWQGLEFDFKTA